jgi:hypothetical protein
MAHNGVAAQQALFGVQPDIACFGQGLAPWLGQCAAWHLLALVGPGPMGRAKAQ